MRLNSVLAGPADLEASRPGGSGEDLLARSADDLAADFSELYQLLRTCRERLTLVGREFDENRAHIPAGTLRLVREGIESLSDRSAAWLQELSALQLRAGSEAPTVLSLAWMAERKRVYADLIRTHQAVAASLITSTDWQSPSFLHSVRSMAGRYTGRISEHLDDYKRDRHGDAADFEDAYLREYVDAPDRRGLRALMTSGGMSAFTTILGWLLLDRLVERPVLLGRCFYHECRELVLSAFGSRVREFDEADTTGTLRLIEAASPAAIFVDSLCNAKGIPVPDIEAMIKVIDAMPNEVHLVVDNTALSCGFQLNRFAPTNDRTGPIVFESLTKYAQFGLDHVTAGMIVAPLAVAERMDAYREHLGTNVADTSVHLVPWPNRELLQGRLARLERNASMLASHLAAHLEGLDGRVFRGIAYPGLPDDPSFGVASRLPFRGGFFEIEFADRYDRVELHRRFVREALRVASQAGVQLTAGASFGLNTTRIYNTASNAVRGRPFVRISAGTEHRLGVVAAAGVLSEAIDVLARA